MTRPTQRRTLRKRISKFFSPGRKNDTDKGLPAPTGRRVGPWMVGGVLLLCATRWAVAAEGPRSDRTARVQRVVDRVREALHIDDDVRVQLVARNPRVASVQPVVGRPGVYLLSVQRDFLEHLADDELEAMVAHELGHVWIYTHHPFLQTEQLANRIAMRRVSRDQLARVYEKVWGASEFKSDLAAFLGVATPEEGAHAAALEPAGVSDAARDRRRP